MCLGDRSPYLYRRAHTTRPTKQTTDTELGRGGEDSRALHGWIVKLGRGLASPPSYGHSRIFIDYNFPGLSYLLTRAPLLPLISDRQHSSGSSSPNAQEDHRRGGVAGTGDRNKTEKNLSMNEFRFPNSTFRVVSPMIFHEWG